MYVYRLCLALNILAHMCNQPLFFTNYLRRKKFVLDEKRAKSATWPPWEKHFGRLKKKICDEKMVSLYKLPFFLYVSQRSMIHLIRES